MSRARQESERKQLRSVRRGQTGTAGCGEGHRIGWDDPFEQVVASEDERPGWV